MLERHAGAPRLSDPFQTTRWSLVLAAQNPGSTPSARAAMEALCQTYWYPLYVYLRRHSSTPDEARDLTQAFFVSVLDRNVIDSANPERGRFRAFLLTACRRFLQNEWRKQNAEKRGGQQSVLSLDFEIAESGYQLTAGRSESAEILFERQWAVALLDCVLEKLRSEYRNRDNESLFDALKFTLTGANKVGYRIVADKLGMAEGAVKVAASRLKLRYRELLRAEIASTVESEDDVQDEIRRLFDVLGSA